MRIVEGYYKIKYINVLKKMERLNSKQEKTFDIKFSFYEYFLNINETYDIYYEFKSLQKHLKYLTIESKESMDKQIEERLREKYNSISNKIKKLSDIKSQKQEFLKLGEELNNCLGYNSDNYILKLIRDNNFNIISIDTTIDRETQRKLNLKKEQEKAEKLREQIKNYKLPLVEIIKDKESQNFKDMLSTGINEKKIQFPLGTNKKSYFFENFNDISNILIGGTVMSGKTSYINSILCYLLMKYTPEQVKFIIISSKIVDYSNYNGIPHLLYPVITDYSKINLILEKLQKEINLRNEKLNKKGYKNINTYNEKETSKIPRIILIVDDIISMSSTNISEFLNHYSTFGWNVGINMIVVANHPTTAYISTLSRANFPIRVSFRVISSKDSLMLLDEKGAEKLKYPGYILVKSNSIVDMTEFEVPYISDNDINKIIYDVCSKQMTNYWKNYFADFNTCNHEYLEEEVYDDPMYDEIVKFAIETGKISASLIQRRFRLGYNRAARLIDILEKHGIIGPQNGSNPREVLMNTMEKPTLKRDEKK